MLEKIGLPAKPSLRGNSWVVDASHCQGCSSQFTFINRKHHCRRCGGIFCNSCTLQRMVLRGQGDSPVRICEPCKKLEEAARFEMRYGHRNRAGRGSSKFPSKDEDEVLSQILGSDKEFSSSGRQANADVGSSIQRESGSASFSTVQDVAALNGGIEFQKSSSVGELNLLKSEAESTSPEELRQRALDEKKKYKILKGEGKSEEALRAFKRGKELERRAVALESSLRKNRRKVLSSGKTAEIQNRDGKHFTQVGKGKDDLISELRELGWSDMDLNDEDKKSATMTVEGELSSLLGGISQGTNKDMGNSGIDKTQVLAHKRRALTLKREGKLAEAKEELKKAKLLEKQLEEQELLGVNEDSDDEISALIRSMDNDNQDELLVGYEQQHGLDLDHLVGTVDDHGLDSNLEVTDGDLVDPEIAATLKSLGWTDDSDNLENVVAQTVSIDKEVLHGEILSLKREALDKKRAGNIPEAMTLLKKAKLLEKDLESLKDEVDNFIGHNPTVFDNVLTSQNINTKNDTISDFTPKSRLVIQKELLALKKRALTLRREGKFEEAEEELKKGKVIEQQLEEMENISIVKAKKVVADNDSDLAYALPNTSQSPIGEGDDNVTDQDMHDPTYLSLLRNLGWNDEENGPPNCALKFFKEDDSHTLQDTEPDIPARATKRSKAELQRELLGLKRKALALRREGKNDEAEEVLNSAKELEAQMAEMEAPKKEIHDESKRPKDGISKPPLQAATEEGVAEDATEKDMQDPTYLSLLRNLGWQEEEDGLPNPPFMLSKENDNHTKQKTESNVPARTSGRSKVEIQRELLGLKRKALTLRREGKSDESEEVLRSAKELEAQMDEMETPEREIHDESNRPKDVISKSPLQSVIGEGDVEDVAAENYKRYAMPSSLRTSGAKDEEPEPVTKGKINFGSDVDPLTDPHVHVESLKEDITTGKREEIIKGDKNGQNNQNSIFQEVLARKRKAVSLKREGKLAQAREELRQAKLLERSIQEEMPEPETSTHDMPTPVTNAPLQEKEPVVSNVGRKPLSGRDRFKLQQESLSHKRQALKLRREGRTVEAEAEFELAKSLEAQLEESASQDSRNTAEPADDVVVEDLLDPQLLSALRDIGIEDTYIVPQVSERPRPTKVSPVKSETVNQERIQLEERIKAEKLKAVNLKRSGKQAEALDALRRAKLFEKKLNSLASN